MTLVTGARSGAFRIGVALAALVAIPGRASAADDGTSELDTHHNRGASPQNFAIEARVALYNPQVDSDPGLHGATPFASTFGGSQRFEVAMEFDWQALRIPNVGTLGPGIAVGYTNANGIAQRIDGGQPPSAESTTLEILPIYAVAVFRLDVLWRQAHIPLVPYAKAGLGEALWRASNTVGTSVAPNGVVGEGHSFGTQVAAGLAFNIGIFDPTSVRNLDEATGINNTYVFAEYMLSTLDGIGQSHVLFVGSDSFVFGLTFEF